MNLDKLLKIAQGDLSKIASRSTFSNVVKLPKGKSRWRILPGWDPENREQFFHDFGQHFIKDADGTLVVVYVCEMETFGRECSVCDKINDMIRSTRNDKTLEMLKGMKARQVKLVNAVRLDGADADPKKPVLLQLPPTSVFQPYLSTLADYQVNHGISILDPKEGRSITIDRTGDNLTTKYNVMFDPTASAVPNEAIERLIDIAQYAEGEFQKGVRKGTALLESATRTVLSMAGSPAGQTLIPSRAERVAPSRTIDVEAEDVPFAHAVKVEPVVNTTVEPAPVVKAVHKAPVAADETALDDKELAAILASLE